MQSTYQDALQCLLVSDVQGMLQRVGSSADSEALGLLRDWAQMEQSAPHLSAAETALQRIGGDAALLTEAVRCTRNGQLAQAEQAFRELLARRPNDAQVQLHWGRLLHNLGQSQPALSALQSACDLAPAYPPAWYSLAHAQRANGRWPEALSAYQRARQRYPHSPAILLNLGISLLSIDRNDEALAVFQDYAKAHPGDSRAHCHLGLALHALGHFEQAEQAYRDALALVPDHASAHFYLGCLKNELMQSEQAQEHLQRSVELDPQSPDAWVELCGLAEQLNQLDVAEQHLQRGLAIAPSHPALQLESARLARRRGNLALALQQMRSLDPNHLPARQAQAYWFERGWAADRAGDVNDAMQAFDRAHQLAKTSPRRRAIDPQGFARRLSALESWLDDAPALPASMDSRATEDPANRIAFLIGFPRSGTTLLDTLLDAQLDITSIEEQPTLETAQAWLEREGWRYPRDLAALSPAQIEAGRAQYLAAVSRFLDTETSGWVLDKLPLRLLMAPLLRSLFPRAPILFSLRHPCDVILSCYMQQFAPTEAFINFDSLNQAAATYVRVMQLWRTMSERLELGVHYVRYEDLIDDPVSQLVAVGARLGVAIDADRIDPHKRLAGRARIRTNSYQQVAEPIYKRSEGRWLRYRAQMEPLLPKIAPLAEWLGYPL